MEAVTVVQVTKSAFIPANQKVTLPSAADKVKAMLENLVTEDCCQAYGQRTTVQVHSFYASFRYVSL